MAGLPAVGIDLSPLAVLIAKVKTSPLRELLRPVAKVVAQRARAYAHPIPAIPRLDHWFKPQIQAILASIVGEINQVPDSVAANALRVALSSIIVRVSNQESDTRYAAINKTISADDVIALFEKAASSLEDALLRTWDATRVIPQVTLINKDVLSVTPSELDHRVSLVVTSTPYPNAYEYWLYHKYRMYLYTMPSYQAV